MWFEILPSMGIIVAALAAPHVVTWFGNQLICGNHFRRQILEKHEAMQYLRDVRLTGSPYVLKGLESIPDN